MAAETYFANHIAGADGAGTEYAAHSAKAAECQIRAGLFVGDVQDLENHIAVIREMLAGRELGLLAGGPPCQGFSLAGRRSVDDPRNSLVWSFLDITQSLRPKFVLIENVSAIQSPFERGRRASVLADIEEALRRIDSSDHGYSTIRVLLRADQYGVPQRRKRVFLIGVRGDIAKALGMASHEWWDSERMGQGFLDNPIVPNPHGTTAPTSRDALWDITSSCYAPIDTAPSGTGLNYVLEARGMDIRQIPVTTQAECIAPPNHKFRSHRSSTKERFGLLRLFQRHGIRGDIFALAARNVGNIAEHLEVLKNVLPVRVSDREVKSLAELTDLVKALASLKHSQRALEADAPAPTITTLPDDLCHYSVDRTLTIREMARLQSFPDTFVFKGKETTGGIKRRVEVPQYSQVGNAVPPLLAEAIGVQLREVLLQSSIS